MQRLTTPQVTHPMDCQELACPDTLLAQHAARDGQGTGWQAVSSDAPSNRCVARTVQCLATIAAAAAGSAFSKLMTLGVCASELTPTRFQLGQPRGAPRMRQGICVMLRCRFTPQVPENCSVHTVRPWWRAWRTATRQSRAPRWARSASCWAQRRRPAAWLATRWGSNIPWSSLAQLVASFPFGRF